MLDHCWVYILLCQNNTYYTGYTTDLTARYRLHCDGTSKCKYTRSFKVQRLAQAWRVEGGKQAAMQVEHYIKRLSRAEKEALIRLPTLLGRQFSVKPLSRAEWSKVTSV